MDAKVIPAALCFGLFLLFAAPVLKGIINLGNGAGMAVTAVLTAIFLLWSRFTSFLGKAWAKPLGRIALSVIGITAAVSLVLAVVISVFMLREANDPPKDENTTVVVLGCKVKDGRPSLMLGRRLEAAYDYLSEHDSVCAVVSGGQGNDESISEAQCMRDWLVGRGIAPERIFMEDKSVNTEENLRFSKKIISENSLPENITLITDGFHQLRADMIAEKQGISAYNVSGRTPWYLLPTYWVREWFGVLHCKLCG
ncbi:MAG: YdcF family protein [Ruminococcus sp.]|nr:YdcF family protein [Ruminococcus sp.]